MATSTEDEEFVNVLLAILEKSETISSSLEVAAAEGVDHQMVVVKALKTLEAAEFVTSEQVKVNVYEATGEGKGIIAAGRSPEKAVFDALTEDGVELETLQEALGKGVVGVGMGPNMKNKWAQKKGSLISRKVQPGTFIVFSASIPFSLSSSFLAFLPSFHPLTP